MEGSGNGEKCRIWAKFCKKLGKFENFRVSERVHHGSTAMAWSSSESVFAGRYPRGEMLTKAARVHLSKGHAKLDTTLACD